MNRFFVQDSFAKWYVFRHGTGALTVLKKKQKHQRPEIIINDIIIQRMEILPTHDIRR